MPAVNRILCPIDFSETSDHAVSYAVLLARQLGAGLHLVHTWQLPVYTFLDGAVLLDAETVARVTDDLQKNLDAAVARHSEPELSVQGHLVQGIPDREIARLAQELDCQMIVMGTHGRTGVTHMLLGSVAERVVRTSPMPVLVVPPPPKEAKKT